MIPKRAFFTWVGQENLPWLRQLSIDTFKKYNPEWKIDVIRIPPKAGLLSAQATDIFRYYELEERGGIYLDTDIIFFKPVPEEILDYDLAFTLDKSVLQNGGNAPPVESEWKPGFTNLAFLGSVTHQGFWKFVYDAAFSRMEELQHDRVKIGALYQCLGVVLLNRLFYGMDKKDIEKQFGARIFNVPLNLVLPIPWYNSHKIFNGSTFDPPDDCIGLHWFGGSVDAKMFQQRATLDSYDRFQYCISQVIGMALS